MLNVWQSIWQWWKIEKLVKCAWTTTFAIELKTSWNMKLRLFDLGQKPSTNITKHCNCMFAIHEAKDNFHVS